MPAMGCSVAGSYVNKLFALTVGPIVFIGTMHGASRCGRMQSIRVRRNTVYLLFLAYPVRGGSVIRLYVCRFPHRATHALHTHRRCMHTLALQRICELIMQAFLCVDLPDGSARLMADLSVTCDSAYKATTFPTAVGFFIMYSLGLCL